MAKAKKKESLSLEEKLEQALVPVDEQPYEVPENWCWVTVGNMVDLHRGVSYKKNEGHSVKEENDCLVMRGGNILEGAIDVEADNIYVDKSLIKTEQYVRENDIIIVSSTGSTKVIGRAGISYADYDDVSFGAFLTLVRPKEQINKRYVDYYFQSQIYRERIRSLASGVNINNIRTEYITNSPIPLPPLEEQQRIVEQIENLFVKLDEAKDKVQEALDSFDSRKNAILYKALSGDYTRTWRVENNISLEDWNEYTIEEICANIVDCPHTTPEWTEEGELCLRTTNIKLGYFDFSEVQYVDADTYRERTERLVPREGDLIFTREGSVGDVALVPANTKLCLGQRMMLMRTSEKCLPEYLLYFLISPFIRNYIKENIMGTTAPRMNIKDIKKFKIQVPPVAEQMEIIRIIKPLLQCDADSKELADIRYNIDMIKKSILAKAFRGELGTNNSSEESSIELLKAIVKE